MINAEIIAVGSELLTPYRIDTNSLWLTEELNKYGIAVTRKHVIGDDKEGLSKLFREAAKRADIVITSGGIGPTFDDITRESLAEAFNRELIYNENIFDYMTKLYSARSRKITENNRRQAFVPEGGIFFLNPVGSAPGLLLEVIQTKIVLLPGPPDELKSVFGRMKKRLFANLEFKPVFTRKFKFAHVPESYAEQQLKDVKLPENANWSILASAGQVEAHLRVTTEHENDANIVFTEFEKYLREHLNDHLFGYDDDELENVVGAELLEKDLTIALAESCTGGWLARRITNVSGSSNFFRMGVVTYSNEAKMQLLNVNEQTLIDHGAVSRPTALEMARGIRRIANSNIGVAITGIAGPTGGTDDKPVGTVFIATVDAENRESCYRFLYIGDRERVRFQATQSALDIVRLVLADKPLNSSFVVKEN